MARPPQFQHPVRRVREALGLKQEWFAENMLGISRFTLRSIENGKMAVTDALARQIFSVTGALPASVKVGKCRTLLEKKAAARQLPKDIYGDKYSNDSLRLYEDFNKRLNSGGLIDTIRAANMLDTLLLAAAEKKLGAGVMTGFLFWIGKTISEFKLQDLVKKQTRRRQAGYVVTHPLPKPETKEAVVKRMRNPASEGMVKRPPAGLRARTNELFKKMSAGAPIDEQQVETLESMLLGTQWPDNPFQAWSDEQRERWCAIESLTEFARKSAAKRAQPASKPSRPAAGSRSKPARRPR